MKRSSYCRRLWENAQPSQISVHICVTELQASHTAIEQLHCPLRGSDVQTCMKRAIDKKKVGVDH